MEFERERTPFRWFKYEGIRRPVTFKETVAVSEGVECDVYSFVDDATKDLGVVRIDKDHKTPLQRVLKGDRTIEGYISGKGRLIVKRQNGIFEVYEVGDTAAQLPTVDIEIGDLMQWKASKDMRLVIFEICLPPYEDGRFENIH